MTRAKRHLYRKLFGLGMESLQNGNSAGHASSSSPGRLSSPPPSQSTPRNSEARINFKSLLPHPHRLETFVAACWTCRYTFAHLGDSPRTPAAWVQPPSLGSHFYECQLNFRSNGPDELRITSGCFPASLRQCIPRFGGIGGAQLQAVDHFFWDTVELS